jgi:hypothetical protein
MFTRILSIFYLFNHLHKFQPTIVKLQIFVKNKNLVTKKWNGECNSSTSGMRKKIEFSFEQGMVSV